MGYSWKRTADKRKILTEKPKVVAQRMAFCERKRLLEERDFQFIYVDETWLDTSYTCKSCWQGPNLRDAKRPLNKGQRLIVVDAGSRNGFVPGTRLMYKASASSGDYHSEMNGDTFGKWLREKLLPNLPPHCAIVMDNASYHSVQSDRCPTSSSRKDFIKVHAVLIT
ncbi:uncharacterized protein LOC132758630 [Ruditapes philippinarum]|uniref:uncharacterized protein LOC132758630 n=1 Tax=Ruditapes philippinarum TaxID=129788 RepID=UPI00295ACAB1|nr:uncharacterized protein LOC132758630 [Ruditapes philippinarum]